MIIFYNMNDELLIKMVREKPELYDSRDPNYLNNDRKARIWQEIAHEMGFDASQCKARWFNIRDNFRKSISKRRQRSGEAAKKLKPYRYERQLQFLLEFMEDQRNLGSQADSDDDTEQDSTTTEVVPSTSSASNGVPSVIGQKKNSPTITLDNPIDCFLFGVSSSLKSMPLSIQLKAKSGISSIVQNFEYEALKRKERDARLEVEAPPKLTNDARKSSLTIILDNPVDCFLWGISSSLKSIPPYIQHNAKAEIFSTVKEFEYEALQKRGREPEPNRDATSRLRNPPTITLGDPVDSFLFGISSSLKSLPPYIRHAAKSDVFAAVQKFEHQIAQEKEGDLDVRYATYPLSSDESSDSDM